MKKVIFLSLVILFCGTVFGVDRYVGDWGTNPPANVGSGPQSDPWLTVGYAFNNMADGETLYCADGDYPDFVDIFTFSGKAITILGNASDRTAVRFLGTATQTYCLQINNTGDTLFTLQDLTVQADPDNLYIIRSFAQTGNVNLKLDNVACSGGNVGASAQGVYHREYVGFSNTAELTNCDITSPGSMGVRLYGAVDYTATDTNITVTSNDAVAINGHTEVPSIDLLRCNITATAGTGCYGLAIGLITLTQYADKCFIRNCTIKATKQPVLLVEYIRDLIFEHNTIECTGNSGSLVAVVTGRDNVVSSNPFRSGRIVGNNIGYTGSSVSHSLLIGAGTDTFEVYGNECYGGDFQMVVKGKRHNIHGNILHGLKPILFKGATDDCKFINNTCVNDGIIPSGFVIGVQEVRDTDNTYYPPNRVYIDSNIFQGANTGHIIKFETIYNAPATETPSGNLPWFTACDYNTYYTSVPATTSLSNLSGDLDTISEMQAAWVALGTYYKFNDAHSINVDPQLVDNKPTNPAVKFGGRPDVKGGKTSMGAIPTLPVPTNVSIYGPSSVSIYGP